MSDIENTIAQLHTNAQSYFPEFAGNELTFKQLPFLEASTYPIYMVEVSNEVIIKKLVIKFAPIFDDFCEGQIEYNNMRHLQENPDIKHENLGFINCLDYLQEQNALIMEFSEGERFSSWFLQNNSIAASSQNKALLEQHIKSAGLWLQTFHNQNKFPAVTVVQSDIEHSIYELLSKANDLNLLSSISSTIISQTSVVLKSLKNVALPQSLVHGDFGLQNINIQDNKVYVFDLQRDYTECIYHDAAYFLVTLDTLNPYPKHIFFSKRRSKRLKQDFLAGYFKSTPDDDDIKMLNIYIIRNLIQRTIKQYNNNKGRFSKHLNILIYLLNRQFEHKIRYYLNKIISN